MIVIILIVITGAGGFFGGMKYQENKSQSTTGVQGGLSSSRGPGGQRFGRAGGGRPTAGEIISTDDKSITVKMMDGSSKIVLLADKTQINKAAQGTKADLTVGVRVAVFGTDNSDGSVTATNIQLNPMFGGGNGRSPNQAQKSAEAKEIVVEGSNYSFTPNKITVKKGEKTRIVFKNKDGVHDFQVDGLNLSTAVVRGAEEDFVEFTPEKAGQYEFYCAVANHRQMGMKGILVVE